jgi:hypothetical protein
LPTPEQAAKLQKQFAGGKHTDVVIRVRIGEQQQQPAAKRARTTQEEEGSASAAASAGAAADGDICTDDIKAHSAVLCAQSAYFDKSLSGDWAEAAERRIELTVGTSRSWRT